MSKLRDVAEILIRWDDLISRIPEKEIREGQIFRENLEKAIYKEGVIGGSKITEDDLEMDIGEEAQNAYNRLCEFVRISRDKLNYKDNLN